MNPLPLPQSPTNWIFEYHHPSRLDFGMNKLQEHSWKLGEKNYCKNITTQKKKNLLFAKILIWFLRKFFLTLQTSKTSKSIYAPTDLCCILLQWYRYRIIYFLACKLFYPGWKSWRTFLCTVDTLKMQLVVRRSWCSCSNLWATSPASSARIFTQQRNHIRETQDLF